MTALKSFHLSEVATRLPRGDVLFSHACRYKHFARPEGRASANFECAGKVPTCRDDDGALDDWADPKRCRATTTPARLPRWGPR